MSAGVRTMPLYRYQSVAADGSLIEGAIESPDKQGVIDRLHALGQIPVRAELATAADAARAGDRSAARAGRRSLELQISLSRDLANLLKAGLPLDRALAVLIDTTASPDARRVLEELRDRVRGGQALSQAMAGQPSMFSPLAVSMTRAGEAGGVLAPVLNRLAEYLERSRQIREAVKTALIYPVILLVVAMVSLVVLLLFVVPQFQVLFADAGRALPVPTQIVIALAEALRRYGVWMLLVAVGAVYLAAWAVRRPAAQLTWHAWLLRVPLLGDVLAKTEMARLARTLGTLLANGVSLLNALAISRETLNNRAMAAAMEQIGEGVRQGRSIGSMMLEHPLFPRLAAQMVRVGEETGGLDPMLATVADLYDQEVERSVKRLLAVLEPALILLMAVVITGVIVSILLGILATNELVT
ncbi:MAG: type II secretion system F family protein [Gammaproteobacteria bacterium]